MPFTSGCLRPVHRTLRAWSATMLRWALVMGGILGASGAAASAQTPMRLGVDAQSATRAVAEGMPVSYGSMWAGSWNQRWGWDGIRSQLAAAKASGVAPVIQWWYWGDDISPTCLERGCWDARQGVQKDKATWYRMSNELADLVVAAMGPNSGALVIVETEFNKNGVESYEPFDGYLADHASIFHDRGLSVVLGFGSWGQSLWRNFDRAAAAADMLGTMVLQSSVRDASTYLSGPDLLIRSAQQLQTMFGKPVFVTDFGFSSYPEPSYAGHQDTVIKAIFARMPELKAAGVQGMVWRMLSDDPAFDTSNYHGMAERSWGLLRADGTRKPGFASFRDGMLAETVVSPTQPAGPIVCTATLDRSAITVSAGTSESTLMVTAPPECAWGATSDSAFIAFPEAAQRAGTGTIVVRIAANSSTTPRQGTATIAGQTVSVAQSGAAVEPAGGTARERARADFNGDGFSDLLWRDSTNGYMAAWTLQGGHATKNAVSFELAVDDPDWRIVGTGDFNGDGKPDLVWHHRTQGRIYLWYMDGVRRIGHTAFSLYGISDTGWRIAGVGDFNKDGKPDLVWQHDRAGWVAVWLLDGPTLIRGLDVSPDRVDVPWKIVGVGDLNADGQSDLIWRNNQNGALGAWLMNGVTRALYVALDPAVVDDFDWQIASIIDVNGDGMPDLVWHHVRRGWIAVWYMNGTTRIADGTFPMAVETNWKIVGPK